MSVKTKVCKKCEKRKPVSEFYTHKNTKDGLRSLCKKCTKVQEKLYRDSPKGQKVAKAKYKRKKDRPDAKEYFEDQYLWRTYKLRRKDKERMYLAQNGCCAICKQPISFNNVHVDHNHITDKIRELLCPPCNTFVGHIENKPNLIESIIKYLEKHNE